MQVLVGTTPVKLPIDVGETAIIQNLGTGTIALGYGAGLTMANGLHVKVDEAYELPKDLRRDMYAVADVAATDVRVLVVD